MPSYDFQRPNNKSPTKRPRTVSANIVSVDEGSLDALLDEVASELIGAMHNERTVRDGFSGTLTYTEFLPEHWRRIRMNNGIERINREIRRRTRVVGTFPDGNSALMLVTARLKRKVKQEEVPEYVEAGGGRRTEGKDGGLEEDGAEAG